MKSMKNNPKILPLIMAIIMVTGLMPVDVWAVGTGSPDDLSLRGPDGIAGNYQHIYYGEYNGTPIRWRILDKSSGELFLLSEGRVGGMPFDDNEYPYSSNEYASSDIREWLINTFDNSFTTEEKAAISPNGNVNNDKTFLLSTGEVSNSTYFPGGNADRAASGIWWLRSPGVMKEFAAYVGAYGNVHSDGDAVHMVYGLRPAFKINLTSVIFTSAAAGGASATVGSNLEAVTPLTGDMKLTIADSSQTLTIGDVTAGNRESGTEVTVNYSGATTSDDNYLGVELTNGSDTYRGVIKALTAGGESGTAIFNLPVTLDPDNYSLRLWNEQYSASYYTNYASTPVSKNIEIGPPNIVSDGTDLPNGIIGTSYNVALTARDGIDPYTWSVAGLPDGFSLDPSTGEISGTPEDTGIFNVTVTVTDKNGKTDTKDFTLTIAQSLSIDLANLTVSPGTLSPAFDKNTVAYQVYADPNINSIDITAQLADPGAVLTIAGNPAADSVAETVYLDQGANLIPVVITAPGVDTQKSYVISVNGTVSNADLSSLTLSEGNLSFDKDTTEYYVNVGNDTKTVDIAATPADSKALVLIDGSVRTSSAIELGVGENSIDIMVVAQDSSTKTYTVTVNRGTGDVNLSDITLSQGALSPAFSTATTQYTASVPYATETITVTPTLADSDAAVKVNGKDQSEPVSLEVGENTINIVVTGKDGVSTKTYTITVTRKEALTIDNENLPIGIIGSAYTVSLTAESGTAPYTWTAAGLPVELTLNETTGEITGTPENEGSYSVAITVTDNSGMEAVKTLTLKINLGCGNGAYIIKPDEDSTYTGGYTVDGIPIMTINEGISGFKYFSVTVEPVTGHSGNEVCVFVHMRNGEQIGISYIKSDLDIISSGGAAFNVKAGDIIKAYIVDDLNNDSDTNPIVL